MHWIYLNNFYTFSIFRTYGHKIKDIPVQTFTYYQLKDKWKIVTIYVLCNTWWMNVHNNTIFETIIIYIFRLIKYTKFHKAVEKYKRKEKKKIPTRVHIAAPRVTSRAEYKPPLGMHAALSFKEVHEVGEWEIMPSTRFLSATGKHNLPPLFFSPPSFFFSLSF